MFGKIKKIIELFDKFQLTIEEVEKVIKYLQYFNYLMENWNLDDFIEALKSLQQDAGLQVDGQLGPKTLKALELPRCGCVDKNHFAARSSIGKWGVSVLKYYVKSYDKDLSKEEWLEEIYAGFNSWTQYIPLDIQRVDNEREANLVVEVGWGRKDNFDGPSGTLAWAYLVPSYNYTGQLTMKFDLDETWRTIDSNQRGIKLRAVAAHEFGHTLGLEHSKKNNALMAPYYNQNIIYPQKNDDVTRIQAVYGKRTTPAPTPDPKPEPDPGDDKPKTALTIIVRGDLDVDSITIPGFSVDKS